MHHHGCIWVQSARVVVVIVVIGNKIRGESDRAGEPGPAKQEVVGVLKEMETTLSKCDA